MSRQKYIVKHGLIGKSLNSKQAINKRNLSENIENLTKNDDSGHGSRNMGGRYCGGPIQERPYRRVVHGHTKRFKASTFVEPRLNPFLFACPSQNSIMISENSLTLLLVVTTPQTHLG
jgi:hypothetical protein